VGPQGLYDPESWGIAHIKPHGGRDRKGIHTIQAQQGQSVLNVVDPRHQSELDRIGYDQEVRGQGLVGFEDPS
jgi:hypothetical protein